MNFSKKMVSSRSLHTFLRFRSRSAAMTSSMKQLRERKGGRSERIGSGSLGGTIAHWLAIQRSDFARFSSAASCASTAFISSSERTTSKEPIEREREEDNGVRPESDFFSRPSPGAGMGF